MTRTGWILVGSGVVVGGYVLFAYRGRVADALAGAANPDAPRVASGPEFTAGPAPMDTGLRPLIRLATATGSAPTTAPAPASPGAPLPMPGPVAAAGGGGGGAPVPTGTRARPYL